MQLVDDRRLADAGIAGHQHELGCALGYHPIEGRKEGVDLGLAAIQLFRDQQPVRHVVRAEREWVDAAVRLPFRQAAPQIDRRRPAAVW